MEAALVSVATGVLKPVLGKLTTLLGNEYKHFKKVRKEIKSLTHELAAMEAFLLKMSEDEDPSLQDKLWMNEVRELSYDMEDAIDDFMQSVGDKDEKPDGFIEKIKNSLGKLGKMKARRRIGKEIQDLKKQIKEVGERSARYRTSVSISSSKNAGYNTGVTISSSKNATVDPRALAIFQHASKLVGIDQPKADIIKLLTKDNVRAPVEQQQQPKIISIVGSGGMGKTTLANQVYKELKGDYKCHAFVSVSRNPDMKNILRTIFSELANKDYGDTELGSIQQLITRITDFLADKRYFVVIDDIWDGRTWDVIKHAFPMSSSDSIIITTTRIIDVAKSCNSLFNGDIYNIRPLNPMHSKELFLRRLFNSKENLPSHLEEVFDEILKKCDGLPLAIIAISGLLSNRDRTEDLWNQVKNSIGRALERNPSVEEMMNILSLSYFDLPPHLKTCLLHLSIFREDTIIKKRDLIRRWIAEGFIQKEAGYTLYEIGERCFNELLNRGLIQPVKKDRYGNKVRSFRVHDTILDFVVSRSIEENFVTLLGVPILTVRTQSKVVRRLSVQGVKGSNPTVLQADFVLSHVRSLTVFGFFMEIPSLREFRHLRVLNLKDCSELEDHHLENIVRLFQLRYLNLNRTKISKLPEQTRRLGCLEMLDLKNTNVEALPASIVNLGKLSHLLVSPGVKFPDGIAKMQALETLEKVNVAIQPFDFLCGLGELKNLRDLLIGFESEVDSDTEDIDVVGEENNKAFVSSLCKLGTQNLRSLKIYYWSSLLQEPLCLPTLEELITWWSSVPQVPTWVSSLRNLQQLRIIVEGVKQDDLCMLGALPSLLILHLEEATESDGKPEIKIKYNDEKLRVSAEIGFQSQRIFVYHARYRRVDLMFGAGSMPKLEKLMLESLHVVEADCLDFGIENLPCLNVIEFIDLRCDEAVETDMERAANAHPNHPTLFFFQAWRK